jgi:alpha-L-fucosidase
MTAPVRPVPDRLRWWLEARFGVSFHWGAYSVPARGEWVRSAERLSVETYQRYVNAFTADAFDARRWAALVRAGGGRYGLLTTKHHDGFCLFDSALTDYTSMHAPARRDLVREYVDAFRAEGLRVGLYYSLLDWHHPDYPAWGDRQHPLRWDESQRGREQHWQRYVEYFHGQIRELLSNYGRIDLLCFDFSYWDFDAERWRADELVRMVRQLQPDIVLNDRLNPGCTIKRAEPPAWAGDFDSPEQLVPDRRIRDAAGAAIPWESWITSNNSWCCNPLDTAWKSSADVIRLLVNCVSKGGNLCLNLGPDARGAIPQEGERLLREVGAWLERNGASIYGCGEAAAPRPEWGRFTSDGQRLYAHLTEPALGHLTLPGLRGRVRNGRVLASGAEAVITDFWNPGVQTFGEPDDIFFNLGKPVMATFPRPDPVDTVVAFDLVPQAEQAAVAAAQGNRPEQRVPFG